MDTVVLTVFALGFLGWVYFRRGARAFKAREKFIDMYPFPTSIAGKLLKHYPHLSEADLETINRGLREYFHICNLAGSRIVSMPSQVVDLAWHEFIVFTRKYERFCAQGLGRFLHHTPAEAMRRPALAQEGIKRAWMLSCKRAKIDARRPDRLPLLFAVDSELRIPDGFKYSLDCSKPGTSQYCAGHIGCGGGCGGDGGACGDADGDSGCSGGCGGD